MYVQPLTHTSSYLLSRAARDLIAEDLTSLRDHGDRLVTTLDRGVAVTSDLVVQLWKKKKNIYIYIYIYVSRQTLDG